jgi:hypothetical protein
MGLKMNDSPDSSTLRSTSDGDIFDPTVKGTGKMTGD